MSDATTPVMRAERAIEEIVAEGLNVTVQAVRERAGVSNAVATQVARAWKSSANPVSAVVSIPGQLTVRYQAALEALWSEARAAAVSEFDEERASLTQRLAEAEDTAAVLQDHVDALVEQWRLSETEATHRLDELRSEAAAAVDTLEAELAQARSRADRAEGALEAVSAERDRVLGELRETRATATAQSSASA